MARLQKSYIKEVSFNKNGSKLNPGITPKMTLPMPVMVDMGITPENKTLLMEYDKETKTITMRTIELEDF